MNDWQTFAAAGVVVLTATIFLVYLARRGRKSGGCGKSGCGCGKTR